MSLELKHLAPYIPYKLSLWYEHTDKTGTISNIYTIGQGFDDHDVKISIDYGDGEHIWMFKPILRPMSQLTEEIEHDGKRFVPNLNPYFKYFVQWEQDMFIHEPLNHCNMSQYEKLLEWHFDIFGLIDKGLAIPKK